MSALNYFNQGSRAIVIQDGATYDRHGIVTRLSVKGCEIPECQAYIAGTGQSGSAEFFASAIGDEFDSIDAFVMGGAAFFERHGPAFVADFRRYGEPRFRCIVSGWSTVKRHILDAAFRLDPETFILEFESDVQWSISPAWGGPVQDQIVSGVERFGPEFIAPDLHATLILDHQRRYRTDASDVLAPSSHLVGGFATLTTIGEEGVCTEVIRRWPEDVIGRPIQPLLASPVSTANVVPFVPANRAERRRQAKVLGRAKA